jgi:hypothetical protein
MDDQTKLNIAVTRFAGFVAELPLSPNEADILQYHGIIQLFEEGCGLDLSLFRIAPDRVKPAIAGTLRAACGCQTKFKEPPVEFGYFLSQVRALTNHLVTVLGSSIKGKVKEKNLSRGWNFSTFAAPLN